MAAEVEVMEEDTVVVLAEEMETDGSNTARHMEITTVILVHNA